MYSIVKATKVRGEDRPEQELKADPGRRGELSSCLIAGRFILSIADWGDYSGMNPLLPDLCDAVNVGIRRGILVFQGIEYPDGPSGPSYPQEWRVKCLGEYPNEAPPTSRARNANRA